MTLNKRIVSVAAAMAVSLFAAGAALAGGQMGGGDMGGSSSSGPQYDPAKEYQKGLDALKAEKWRAAANAFSNVLTVRPKDVGAMLLLGEAKTKGGDLKGALRAYERAVKVDPDNLIARREIGVLNAKLGQAAKAQAALDDIKARQAACGACMQSGDLKVAQEAIEAAMAAPAGAAAAPGM